jgi:hypothetical protein
MMLTQMSLVWQMSLVRKTSLARQQGPVMTKKYATATMMEPQQENTHLEQMQERPLGEQTEIPLREPQVTMTKPETKAARHSPPPVTWNPFWVQKWVLTGLVSLFAALLVALGLLCHFSNTHNGISTRLSNNSDSWKYGPPAGLLKPTSD